MIQEGHSKEVYALGCQDDGALIASGSVFNFFFFSSFDFGEMVVG